LGAINYEIIRLWKSIVEKLFRLCSQGENSVPQVVAGVRLVVYGRFSTGILRSEHGGNVELWRADMKKGMESIHPLSLI
jgi:hypothetical protein